MSLHVGTFSTIATVVCLGAALVATSFGGCSSSGGCRSGRIYIDFSEEAESEAIGWEIETADTRFVFTCKYVPDDATGTRKLVQEPEADSFVNCESPGDVRVDRWPLTVRARARDLNGSWAVTDWVEYEQFGPGQGECPFWEMGIRKDGTLIELP